MQRTSLYFFHISHSGYTGIAPPPHQKGFLAHKELLNFPPMLRGAIVAPPNNAGFFVVLAALSRSGPIIKPANNEISLTE